MKLSRSLSTGLLVLVACSATGCGKKEFVRGANDPSIDSHALSTGLDKEDIRRMLHECLNDLRTAVVMNRWREHQGQDTVAIFPPKNETSEHIDSMLKATLSETEEWLVNSNVVTVISRERQKELIGDVRGMQGSDMFDTSNAPQAGKQIGAKYVVTIKVQAADERTDDMRRVQYILNMQILEVETGAIRWQKKAYVTKALR